MVTVWHEGKDGIYRLFSNPPSGTHIAHESTCRVPHEIVEIIHLTHEPLALKACSLTCRSWNTVAVPHLHHTLTLGNGPYLTRGRLKPLSKLHGLGLIPLVREIRMEQPFGVDPWFVPGAFGRRDLRYFAAFADVQTLALQCFQIYHFIPKIERYFEHFSPTVRSIVLSNLHCTPRQLFYLFSLFPNGQHRDPIRSRIHTHLQRRARSVLCTETARAVGASLHPLGRNLDGPHRLRRWFTVSSRKPACERTVHPPF